MQKYFAMCNGIKTLLLPAVHCGLPVHVIGAILQKKFFSPLDREDYIVYTEYMNSCSYEDMKTHTGVMEWRIS